jgi:DNA-directed RNA polymerase subunit B
MKTYELLFKKFWEYSNYVNHQIESFNEFINFHLKKIIDTIGDIELESPGNAEFKIRLGKIKIPGPYVKEADGAVRKITPMEARIRDMTYASPIFIEMIPIINGVEQDPQEVKLGEIPVMVKSNICTLHGMSRDELKQAGEDPDDLGGYFIINGTERVIIMLEEVVANRPIIERRGGIETIRINSESNGFVQRHLLERRDGVVTISFANLKKLPIVTLLRALGLEKDQEIVEHIATDKDEEEEVYFNLFQFPEDPRSSIGSRLGIKQKEYRERRIDDILDKYLLPHLGQEKEDRKKKIEYLVLIVRSLIKLGLEKIPTQDIDHYTNKRITLAGEFMEIAFRSILLGKYGLVNRISYSYQKLVKRGKMPILQSIVESDYLTKRIISHMATGQWVGGRTGVCQRLERTNFLRSVSHLRNIVSPLSASQEHFEARALHPTSWGRLCCEKTPEGVNIGLRKYMAAMVVVSRGMRPYEERRLEEFLKRNLDENGSYKVFVDGIICGSTNKPLKIIQNIKEMRRKDELSHHINISTVKYLRELHINTDRGRLQRPLIVVHNGKSKLTKEVIGKLNSKKMDWHDLLKKGIVEYLDAEEEDDAYVALHEEDLTKEHTHLEIHPGIILGLSASLIPFAPNNRGDRVNFGAKMCGQAIGIPSLNFFQRSDTKSDVLVYVQKPLVSTMLNEELNVETHPYGQNIIVALMSFQGYNMEDGLIFNKASIERGLARSFFFRAYTTEEKKYWGIEKDEITIPDKSVSGYRTEDLYANLGADGIINREINVQSGDVLVGKISPLRFFGPREGFMMETENRRETSETVRHGEDGVVDNVFLTETESGDKLVKVIVRSERIPELGDKFASRHGQKGVIGLIVPEEDMPFTKDGLIPDIIVNPHAIPSRMTLGQILEIITGKYSSMDGKIFDASAFNKDINEQKIRENLKNYGFRDDGKETMYDGVTGNILESRILIGPCYYQKLYHMVSNKIQSRARGPVTLLTKQPTAGRAKQGGLRLGEMEKDCLVAHGTALLLKERFDSDRATIPICKKCGLVALDDHIKDKKYCPVCKKSKIVDVDMSYAFKLMLDELKCMGIYPKIMTD